MSKLIDNIWLWGQDPGSHHVNPAYNLPGENKMTAIEGCDFFGIKNCCRVAMSKGPIPPFDNESIPLDKLDNVVWSVVGAGGITRNEENFGDLDEVIRQAKSHKNICGGIMDDFLLSERRRALYTPDKLREATGLPVNMWDERRTTVEAHNILSAHNYHGQKRKNTVDAVAASLILEGYLAFRSR